MKLLPPASGSYVIMKFVVTGPSVIDLKNPELFIEDEAIRDRRKVIWRKKI